MFSSSEVGNSKNQSVKQIFNGLAFYAFTIDLKKKKQRRLEINDLPFVLNTVIKQAKINSC